MKKLLFLFIAATSFNCKKNHPLTETPATKPKYTPVSMSVDAYTKVQYGNMPLVISAPHGGTLHPTGIPDRTCPGITTTTDLNTSVLLLVIDSIAKTDYHVQPSWIYTDLSRLKLDENRPIDEATCSNPAIYSYWNNYHNYTDSCIRKLRTRYPGCIFIDLHGHGHAIQRCELGYLFTDNQLRSPSSLSYTGSSLYNGMSFFGTKTIQQMLTGSTAFGTYLAANGFPAVPSSPDPAPASGDPYFDGGYNTSYFTGSSYPNVVGWQIESNYTGLRDTNASRIAFAKAFLNSIFTYLDVNMNMQAGSFGY